MKKSGLIFLLIAGSLVAYGWSHRDSIESALDGSDEDSNEQQTLYQPVPHVVLPNVQGEWVNLDEYKGKVMLVNFWTTWCDYCREETANLIKLQGDYAPKGFTVVAIAIDDQGEEGVAPFVENERFDVDGISSAVNFPVLMGHKEIPNKFGGIHGIPASFLISREGKQVTRFDGPIKYAQASKAIKKLL